MVPRTKTCAIGATAAFVVMLAAAPVFSANQDEIQVYDDAINKPGEVGLEIHMNTTPAGRTFELYPGEITNAHGFRITPEFSYGLTKDLELGFYLDTERDGDGTDYLVGTKYRIKWLPIHSQDNGGFFAGANVEYSNVGSRFSESRDGLELRMIGGFRSGDWLIAFNPVFDWDLSGFTASSDPEFTAALKVTRKVAEGVAAGIEYYGDVGKIDHLNPWNKQDQRIYGVFDLDLKPFALNLGAGVGLTKQADAWTVKGILEVPVEEIFKR